MKYLHLVLAIIFTLFAYWQFNDPDPVWWITIYLVAAYMSFKAYKGEINKELNWVLTILMLAGTVNSGLQMTAWEGLMSDGLAMKTLNQELAREALGLFICTCSFILGLFTINK